MNEFADEMEIDSMTLRVNELVSLALTHKQIEGTSVLVGQKLERAMDLVLADLESLSKAQNSEQFELFPIDGGKH